jgi:hypothetical protein
LEVLAMLINTTTEEDRLKKNLLSLAGTFDEEDYQDFMEALKDFDKVYADEWSFD